MKTQANLGWMGPDAEEILVTNRTGSAVAVGDVEMLDNFRDQAESTSNQVGAASGGTSSGGVGNAVVALAKARQVGIFGVIQSAAADNANCRMRLRGYVERCAVDAAVVLTTPSICAVPLTTETVRVVTNQPAGTAAAGEGIITKVCFIPLTAIAGAGTTDGWFDGINGLGWVTTQT